MPDRVLRGWRVGAALALGFLSISTAGGAEPGDRIAEVFAARVEMQRQMASWLEGRLADLAAPYRLLVAVKLTMRGEIRDVVQREEAAGSELKIGSSKAVKLPGLPVVDKPLTGPAAPDISVKVPGRARVKVERQLESQVEKVAVHLFVERGMPAAQLERVKQVASELAGLDPARGDALDVAELEAPPRAGVSISLLVVCGTALLAALFLALAIGRRARPEAPRAAAGAGAEAEAEAEGEGVAQEGAQAGPQPGGEPGPEVPDDGRPRPFGFLRNAAPDELSEVLSELDPAIAAAVLDKFPAGEAAVRRLFEGLPAERRLALALALGRSRVLPRAAVQQMEEHVLAALDRVRGRMRLGGEARLADVLAFAPSDAQRELMDGLGKVDPALAKALRGKMLLFEDLARLAPESVRQVVTGVPPPVVASALAGATPEVQDAVMTAVSKRLRGILEAEAETLAEQRPEEAEGARRQVEQVLRRLHARGTLRSRAA